MQRRRRQFGGLQQRQNLCLGLVVAALLRDALEHVAVLPPTIVVGEPRVVEQLRMADEPAPPLEHRLSGDLKQPHPASFDR
jgi:hypothetical protein